MGELSGGQKQRVLLSQALLGNPTILILDEPTAGLDPKERIRIRNLIGEISYNKIVLIATHVVSDIEFVAKEILFLNKGELIEQGSPSLLLRDFRNKVFAGIIKKIDVTYMLKNFQVSRLNELADDLVYVKVCGDFDSAEIHNKLNFKPAEPTLEDLYLYLFRDESKKKDNIDF